MSHVDVFYEGNFSTRAVHLESDCEALTDMLKLSPTELLAASLGSCILTVMALAARKLEVNFERTKVSVVKEMAKDLPRRVGSLTIHFSHPEFLPEEICKKLELAGRDCPVHHSLNPDIKIDYHFKWGAS
jgi:putative redox protein